MLYEIYRNIFQLLILFANNDFNARGFLSFHCHNFLTLQKPVARYDILEAILTSTQPGEKLQCWYANLMSNTDFRIKTTVLKKI